MAHIIFDFDGTLADSLPLVIEGYNAWVNNGEPISEAEIEELRNLPASKVLKQLGIPMWRAPGLLARGRKELKRRLPEVPMFPGLKKVLSELHGHHTLYILSTNSDENIKIFLHNNGVSEYFKDVYGDIGIFGKSKALQVIMRNYGLTNTDTYYVGDEVRDIVAAHKRGLRMVAVDWGYNGHRILKSYDPEFFAHKPTDLNRIFAGGA